MAQNWIPLVDYSTKHQVSISTLRRKIRCHAIPYKIDQGKYFLQDEPVELSARGRARPATPNTSAPAISVPQNAIVETVAPAKIVKRETHEMTRQLAAKSDAKYEEHKDPQATTFSAATKILEELKKAYAAVLQEKEEQICQLKEEVSDLRTLARVLESENERLRKESGGR